MNRKQLPIGISDYKMLIEGDYYFVDKTDMIRQIVEESSIITMLPRPRRFGKTLNLSMLRYFFERTEGNRYRPLFNGMRIEQWRNFEKHQGKYPVIMLTLKDCKGNTLEDTLEKVRFALQKEFIRHKYLLADQEMEPAYRPLYEAIYEGRGTQKQMENALEVLSDLLTAHWGIAPLVLLDEYDSPIHVAYDHDFYDEMVIFMRNFMSGVFKDNTAIFRGVITGILRVSKESLFSGLNNMDVNTILDQPMCHVFGFTQSETGSLLDYYSLGADKDEVKEWYDGYLFGGEVAYNPWSVLNYIKKGGVLSPYWVNTGSDMLLRKLVAGGPAQVRCDMEVFLKGGSIRSVVNDKLAFPDLMKSTENVWSFMLFSGYLKASEYEKTEDNLASYRLEVPNREVQTVFKSIIRGWIDSGTFTNSRIEEFIRALESGEIRLFERILSEFVLSTLSYYDTSGRDVEKVYQAFLLGILINAAHYEVSSNREAGLGRYDIVMRPKDIRKQAFIMELKVCDTDFGDTVESVLDEALKQIEQKQYAATLRAAGITDILCLAITFDGKRVWAKKGSEA